MDQKQKTEKLTTQANSQTRKKKFVHQGHEVVRKLKQAQSHIDTVRKRCMLLKVQEDLNRIKTIQQERKINFLEEVRISIEKDKQRINTQSLKKIKQMQLCYSRNLKLKAENKDKINEMRNSIMIQKHQINKLTKEQSHKIQERIKEFRKQDQQQKKQRKKSLDQYKQRQRKNISDFYSYKIKQTNHLKEEENYHFKIKLQKKKKQLQALQKQQDEMIKRTSESIQSSRLVQNRLNEVLGSNRYKNKQRQKLPGIKSQLSTNHETITL